MAPAIPVQNLYYLFLYAWDRLPEGQSIDVSGIEGPELPNLLAKVLLEGTRHLLRRGLDRGYREQDEDTSRLRGRILLSETVARNLLIRAQTVCRIDELSRDVLHNRIIKTVAARLARTLEVEPDLRAQLRALVQGLEDVAEIPLTGTDFRRVQLHGNNAFYGFLLRVCALAHDALVPEQGYGRFRFRDVLADEQAMGRVFQGFIRNFYHIEQTEYRVTSDKLTWAIESDVGRGHELLPWMETDVLLRSKRQTIVIECKWYRAPLVLSHGQPRIRADHLYQLFAYLKNLEARGANDAHATGVLLYPEVGTSFDVECQILAHKVQVRSLDLTQSWASIRAQILSVLLAD